MNNGRGWGRDVTILPGWKRLGQAAGEAVLAPEVWGPLVCAAALQAGDADHRISRWAADKTPVFGSRDAADQASGRLLDASRGIYLISLVSTPSGDNPLEWTFSKLKGLAVGTVAHSATTLSTNSLKDWAGRTRPDGSDRASFPSLTTSHAAVFAELASQNIKSIPIDSGARTGLRAGALSLSAATGWARVEAKKHYPSDVLVGAALGHLMGIFFNNAFLGLDTAGDYALRVEPLAGGFSITVSF